MRAVRSNVTQRKWSIKARAQCLPEAVHFVGIGGAGLAPLAVLAQARNIHVTGSDASSGNERINALIEDHCIGVSMRGHAKSNVPTGVTTLVLSDAVSENVPEAIEMHDRGGEVLSRYQWVQRFTAEYTVIAIAGTHGKSTTAAMVAQCLRVGLHWDCSVCIGANALDLPSSRVGAHAGSSDLLVIEADEHCSCLSALSPSLLAVVSIDDEHMPSDELMHLLQHTVHSSAVQKPEERCPKQLDSVHVVVNNEDAGCKELAHRLLSQNETKEYIQVTRVGIGDGSDTDCQLLDIRPSAPGGIDFAHAWNGVAFGRVSVSLPGIHNAINAATAISTAAIAYQELQTRSESSQRTDVACTAPAMQQLCNAIGQMHGIQRRFEEVARVRRGQIVVIDDYAHHPAEIRATLQACRLRHDKATIWAAFQPHATSRIRRFINDFAPAFSAADRVLVCNTFCPRGREVDDPVEAKATALDLVEHVVGVPCEYTGAVNELIQRVQADLHSLAAKEELQKQLVIVVMGASSDAQKVAWNLADTAKKLL